MSSRRISLYVVYDLIGAFGIGGGNHLGIVRTVEKEHVNYPLLLRSRALPITGLNLAPRPEATTLSCSSLVFSLFSRPLWLCENIKIRETSMPQPVCPKCSSDYVKRVSRIGFDRLISLFYIYPFRCLPCGHRFRFLQWCITYTKIELDQDTKWKRRQKEARR